MTTARPLMLITGGSRGIGAAVARLAASAGHDLCLSYATNARAAAQVQVDCQALGADVRTIQADVAREDDVLGLFAAADEMGPLRSLINNAGVVAPIGQFVDYSAERIQRVMDVNVVGALLCAREAARRMSTTLGGAGGSIVNNSSKASTLGSPNEFVDYAASKGAMDSMTIGLAKELGGQGIRVNAVRPGLIETDIHASAGDAGRVERLAVNVPQKRGGTANEVAELIMWLTTEQASYVNGALIDVAGGR